MLTRLLRLVAALVLARIILFAAALAASDPAIISYTLDNGLKVILAPNKTAQNVALVTVYHVGSANEAPGRSGFAHLFEHLMFEGTAAIPEFDKSMAAVGGQNNAFTETDTTTYYMTGPSQALPVFLRLDADRMANLANAVNQQDLDNQRDIVLNEMRQRVLDQPGAAARQQAEAELYPPGHPYAHATIGSIADLKKAKLEDVIAFHRTWYVPENATVAITGNFDAEQAKAWISETFARVPRGQAPAAPVAAPVQAKAERLLYSDAVPNAVVSLNWPTAGGMSRDTIALSLAGRALLIGDDSLQNRLTVKDQIAAQLTAGRSDGKLSGRFSVLALAAKDVPADALEAKLRAAFAEVQKKGLAPATLAASMAEIEAAYATIPNDPVSFAFMLAGMADYVEPQAWRAQLDIAKTITLDEVNAALRTLSLDTAQTMIIAPGARNTTYPPVIANSTGESAAASVAARPEISIPEIAPPKPASLKLPAITTATLSNGAGLTVYSVADPAEMAVSLLIEGGASDGPPGLVEQAMAVDRRGAANRNAADNDKALREKGVSIYATSSTKRSLILAKGPIAQFDTLLAFLSETVQAPRFDDKEWQNGLDQMATGLERAAKQPDFQAMINLLPLLYPDGAPEQTFPSAAQVRALKRTDAEAMFKALMQPSRAHFHVAGNMPLEDVKAALEEAFAGWKDGGTATTFAPYTQPILLPKRKDVAVEGATQAAVFIAMKAPPEGTRRAIAYGIAVEALGGSSNSRLNAVLREEKGWSYGINAQASGDKGQDNALLSIQTLVQADKAEESLKVIQEVVKNLASKPLTAEELTAAKQVTMSQIASTLENAASVAGFAVQLAAQGYKPEDFQTYLDELASITLDEVNAEAREIANSPMAVSIAGAAKAAQ